MGFGCVVTSLVQDASVYHDGWAVQTDANYLCSSTCTDHIRGTADALALTALHVAGSSCKVRIIVGKSYRGRPIGSNLNPD